MTEKNQREMQDQIEIVQQELTKFKREMRQEILKLQMDMQEQSKMISGLLIEKKNQDDHVSIGTASKEVEASGVVKTDALESSEKRTVNKKKENSDHTVRKGNISRIDAYVTQPTVAPPVHPRPRQQGTRPQHKKFSFTPLSTTYTEMYPKLLKSSLVKLRYAKATAPVNGKFPFWYDGKARYEFHMGNVGHTVENCLRLKYQIQELIDNGSWDIYAPNGNPLLPSRIAVDVPIKEKQS